MQKSLVSPKYIHQIMINNEDSIHIPPIIGENIRSIQNCYPDATYKLWNHQELLELIRDNFDTEVVSAFNTLKPFAYKADLGRLCLAYVFGGLYIDLGIRLIQPIEVPTNFGLLAFRDFLNINSIWTCVANGVFWVQEPNRKEIKLCIDKIVEHCKNRYYGENSLYPTGPVLFGQCITKTMIEADNKSPYEFWIGDIERLAKNADTIFFVTPLGQVFGYRIKSISHSEVTDALKANQYGPMWDNRNIYEDYNCFYRFADNPKIHVCGTAVRTENGVSLSDCNDNEIVCYGPYITLNEGQYEIEVALSEGSVGHFAFEITANTGETKLFEAHCDAQVLPVVARFIVEYPIEQVEVRINAKSNFKGTIVGYNLIKME